MEYVNQLAKDAQSSVESLIGSPKLTLFYFDIQGPAEPARLALTIGGIEFTDKRVTFDEMKAMRAAGELKGGGQVPQLHIGDQVLSQSNAIATYCSKLAGLYPSDPLAAARVDEIIQFITEDVRGRCIYPTMRVDDADEKAKMRKKLAEEQLPEKFTLLEAMMDATYCCGDSLTLADFYVYGLLNWIGMNTLDGVPHTIILECGSASQARGRGDGVPADATPSTFSTHRYKKLTNLVVTLNNHPKIKAWNAAKNPKLPWYEPEN